MNDRPPSTASPDTKDVASQTNVLPFHGESTRIVAASAAVLFAHLDDHGRLTGHMSKSSWMMAGSSMGMELDAAMGRAKGSHIQLRGRVLGSPIHVEEVVTEHEPPLRKVWETIGTPNLLVIGPYKMGCAITPQAASSQLRVFIDYDLPGPLLLRLLGRLLGGFYARWCTESMASDTAAFFAPSEPQLR